MHALIVIINKYIIELHRFIQACDLACGKSASLPNEWTEGDSKVMGVHVHMLDVLRAPPNGTAKEPADKVSIPDPARSSLTQMAHTTPYIWNSAVEEEEEGTKERHSLHLQILCY